MNEDVRAIVRVGVDQVRRGRVEHDVAPVVGDRRDVALVTVGLLAFGTDTDALGRSGIDVPDEDVAETIRVTIDERRALGLEGGSRSVSTQSGEERDSEAGDFASVCGHVDPLRPASGQVSDIEVLAPICVVRDERDVRGESDAASVVTQARVAGDSGGRLATIIGHRYERGGTGGSVADEDVLTRLRVGWVEVVGEAGEGHEATIGRHAGEQRLSTGLCLVRVDTHQLGGSVDEVVDEHVELSVVVVVHQVARS